MPEKYGVAVVKLILFAWGEIFPKMSVELEWQIYWEAMRRRSSAYPKAITLREARTISQTFSSIVDFGFHEPWTLSKDIQSCCAGLQNMLFGCKQSITRKCLPLLGYQCNQRGWDQCCRHYDRLDRQCFTGYAECWQPRKKQAARRRAQPQDCSAVWIDAARNLSLWIDSIALFHRNQGSAESSQTARHALEVEKSHAGMYEEKND